MNSELRQKIEKIVVEDELTGKDLRHHHSDYPSLGRMFAPVAEELETFRDEEVESLQAIPIGFRNGSRAEGAKERETDELEAELTL